MEPDIPHTEDSGTQQADTSAALSSLTCPHCASLISVDITQYDTGSLALCPSCHNKSTVLWTKSGNIRLEACTVQSGTSTDQPAHEMNLLWALVALVVAYVVTQGYLDDVCSWLKLNCKHHRTWYWLAMFSITWLTGVVIHRIFREAFFVITLLAVLKFISGLVQ